MKDEIVAILAQELKLDEEEINKRVEIPPSAEMGDYAFPCFFLAKEMKKNPVEISANLLKALQKRHLDGIEKIEQRGAYLNFFVDKTRFAKELLAKATSPEFGSARENEKILVEHTSINPNASPHIGRTRNSIIADSIVRILKFRGNKVKVHYYVNDVSKQIAILALVFKPSDKFSDMLGNYIKISKKAKDNPVMEKKIFEMLEKFEKRDEKTVALFRKIVQICVEGQKKILSEFGIEFDSFDYESKYVGEISKELLKKFEKTGKLFEDKENRLVLDLSHTLIKQKMKSPVFVLARSNGTGLYGLRDIAYTLEKMNHGRNILVLGEDQKLYFEQIKESLKLLGCNAPEVVHYSFVLIQTKQGARKMSTRRGELVLLEDFLKEAVCRAEMEIKKRRTKGDAKKIAIGAIKFSMLRNDNNKNIIFDWDNSLNFSGESGPYLQYSYARASSIMKKAGKISRSFKIENINEYESALVKKISRFPGLVEQAEKGLNPSLIANYSFELAQCFNEFYHKCPVIGSENEVFRIKLVEAFRQTIKNSVYLLGIDVMEEM